MQSCKMLFNYAPPSLIKPVLHFTSSFALSPRAVPHPVNKIPLFHSLRISFRTFAAMSETNSASDSTPDHIYGTWYSVPGLRLRDHRFTVPLDYSIDRNASPKLSVFAREVVSGLSAPLTPSSMSQLNSAEEVAEYLKYFRADNIVNDAEFIRVCLVPEAGPWTVLGQSYGGFCSVTYLSFAPQGLKQVLLTGGIPPIGNGCTADSVYRACYAQVIHQNEKYYKRFPQDVEIVHEVVKYLAESEGGGVLLPSGGLLTPRGLQTLGLSGLGSSSGFERLHYMFERVWDPVIVPGFCKQISYYFLNAFENWLDFDTNPLYALLHESIYCQGDSSRWSAQRIRTENGSKFDAIRAVKEGRPVFFTGEMVFPWMFEEVHALRKFKDAAHLLAEKKDWPPLYDIAVLNNNKVPVAAAVYYEDMYANFKLAMETASQIAGIRLWITNEYMHSGLRDGGGQVLDHLLGMLNGRKPLF
ncbi:hypothetical protein POTOM_046615 [Populus tomentosa]|uniref:AB hydrolase-1 domain-containing protein n=1 Tax=Populus tomentosa TaxID=118781 RepID=A0A8X7YB66_POPTO|nr:hypothetical protein POTOM_046615 [Populus tomentosa]